MKPRDCRGPVETAGTGKRFTRLGGYGFRAVASALWYHPYWRQRLAHGIRVPPQVTYCQTYLWQNLELTRLLLENGMDPNLPNWQQIRPLHHMGRRGEVDEARLFIEFGADPGVIDEEYRTTPLGWAARCGQTGYAQFLLERFPEWKIHHPPEMPEWEMPEWSQPIACSNGHVLPQP